MPFPSERLHSSVLPPALATPPPCSVHAGLFFCIYFLSHPPKLIPVQGGAASACRGKEVQIVRVVSRPLSLASAQCSYENFIALYYIVFAKQPGVGFAEAISPDKNPRGDLL